MVIKMEDDLTTAGECWICHRKEDETWDIQIIDGISSHSIPVCGICRDIIRILASGTVEAHEQEVHGDVD